MKHVYQYSICNPDPHMPVLVVLRGSFIPFFMYLISLHILPLFVVLNNSTYNCSKLAVLDGLIYKLQ